MTTDTLARPLPHWDMTVVYPSLDSPAFAQDFAALVEDIAALGALWDTHGIAAREATALDDSQVAAFDAVIMPYNELLSRVRTLGAYIHSFVTTNSRDDVAQARASELQQHLVDLSQLGTRFTAWIGSLDVPALIERSPAAAAHAFMLERTAERATHLMSPAEEALAAALQVTGSAAWSRLHSTLSSQIEVPVEMEGRTRTLPMSEVRNLAAHPDREVRRHAYEAELVAWSTHAVPLAAALNSIKGEVGTLATRRGWESPLAESLFSSGIDRATLDAMLDAVRTSLPDLRRYLKAKARLLRLPALAWYDLGAPIGSADRVWGWDEATTFIETQFGTFAPHMRDLATRAFRERWVDAEPRGGKRDGAFCMALRGGESRILANYAPNFHGVTTLAHELGHAYHNHAHAGRNPLQRSTPMTLAETASTFCETIVMQAGLRVAEPAERLALLEQGLQGASMLVIDILSRYLFESRVFAARRQRDLSVADLNALMLEVQGETYGDGLDPLALHPYMWAVKGHYYSGTLSFYNYPYTFGHLFGLGLYARYEAAPESFVAGYDDLLSATGMTGASALAARFGIALDRTEFWLGSLDVIRRDVDAFEQLVAGA